MGEGAAQAVCANERGGQVTRSRSEPLNQKTFQQRAEGIQIRRAHFRHLAHVVVVEQLGLARIPMFEKRDERSELRVER